MRIGICDDDRQDRQMVQELCQSVMKKNLIDYELYVFQNGLEVMEFDQTLDLLILDIEMPEMSGIEVKQKLQTLGQQTLIIFVSSHEDQILPAFGVHVYGFVIKEQVDKQFVPILESAVNLMSQTVWIEGCINSRSVKYIKSDRIYCDLFMENGEHRLMRSSIQEYEELLSQVGFVKTHKSYLVNLRYVTKLASKEVYLGTEAVPLAVRMRKNVEKQYREFCERNARYC